MARYPQTPRLFPTWTLALLVGGLTFLGPVDPRGGSTILLGQESTSLSAALALEKQLVAAIAAAESSVVAIARVRKSSDDGAFDLPQLDDGFPGAPPSVTDPNFIPNEYATGVIIDPNGLILTTYHVLGNPDENDYYIWHQRIPYKATRVEYTAAADPWMDLAVLKIDARELPPITFGDASELKKGQIVITLGNPLAIARDGQISASWGIVSNLARKAPPRADEQDVTGGRDTLHHFGSLIQTDTRLNRGTSGGALINLRGEMVGLTTALTAGPAYETAAGFAIPVDEDLKRTVEVLKAGRRADFGFLGVLPAPLTREERQRGGRGARVRDVWGATPAAQAGIRAGDIILAVNNQPVFDDNDIIRHVGAKLADTQVALTIQRNNQLMTRQVTLSKKPLQTARPAYAREPDPVWRGLTVEYLTAMPGFQQFGRLFELQAAVGVLDVQRNSPAWEAGLRTGDFITHVAERSISKPAQFHTAATAHHGEVSLTVVRSGRTLNVTVPPE